MRLRFLPRWLKPRHLRMAGLLALLALAAFTLYLDFRVRDEFEGRRFALPARVYARPLELHVGLRASPGVVERELRLIGYRAQWADGETAQYRRLGDVLDIATRPFTF